MYLNLPSIANESILDVDVTLKALKELWEEGSAK
ncbi:MAG: hypothetical protein HMLIMOIP_000916 [Candidatus Nitrosomirales archaeon]|jgi:hypothetical protein